MTSTMPTTNISVLLLMTLWASAQDGLGLPLMKHLEAEEEAGVQSHRGRTKRCACSSLLDSECHYFCHLDIVWVNTPGKTTVYGLGSILSRRRRSTCRCTCASPDDQTCANFCCHSPEIIPKRSVHWRQLDILSILRAMASRPESFPIAPDSMQPSVDQRRNAR